MMSPELAESIVLGTATIWCLILHKRHQAGRIPLFTALYLGLPAIGLFAQGMGWSPLVEELKWIAVAVNAGITTAFIHTTHRANSEVLHAMVEAERNMAAREARVRAYTLATFVLRELPSAPTGTLEPRHAALG